MGSKFRDRNEYALKFKCNPDSVHLGLLLNLLLTSSGVSLWCVRAQVSGGFCGYLIACAFFFSLHPASQSRKVWLELRQDDHIDKSVHLECCFHAMVGR